MRQPGKLWVKKFGQVKSLTGIDFKTLRKIAVDTFSAKIAVDTFFQQRSFAAVAFSSHALPNGFFLQNDAATAANQMSKQN